MEKRVYRGKCPNEDLFEIEFDGNCKNCENYHVCKRKERRRRKRMRRFYMKLAILIALIIAFVAFIALFISIITHASGKNNNVSTASSSIIIDSGSSEATKISIDVSVPTESVPQETSSTVTIENNIEVFTSNSQQIIVEILPRISAYGPGEVYYYELSYEDKVYMAKVVYAESRGEIFEGQVAVAATVLNRYESDDARFDRTSIYAVITQSCQFASISNVTMEDLENCPSCMEAVEAACKGWDPTRALFEDGAKFFFNPDGDLSDEARAERTGIDTYRIGNHLFHNDFSR